MQYQQLPMAMQQNAQRPLLQTQPFQLQVAQQQAFANFQQHQHAQLLQQQGKLYSIFSLF